MIDTPHTQASDTPIKVRVLRTSVINNLVRQPGDIVTLPAGTDLHDNVEVVHEETPLSHAGELPAPRSDVPLDSHAMRANATAEALPHAIKVRVIGQAVIGNRPCLHGDVVWLPAGVQPGPNVEAVHIDTPLTHEF